MHWIALQPLPDAVQASQGQGDEPGVADPLVALAWQALQFTPKVARVALDETTLGGNEALVMEISGSEMLFGGRPQLLRLIYKSNKALGLVKHAQAATSLIAISKIQFDSGKAMEAPDALPLTTLAAARPHLATLARIGCTCWGDVRALPRGGVVRRFGAELLDALDRAYGLKAEIYPWLTLPAVFDARIELHAQVETAPALMFGALRLFKQLHLWLQLRNEGVAALEFGWVMDARRNVPRTGALALRTAQATQDIAHLQRLLGENLARLTLPAPVLYLSLRTLETEAMAGISASLLLEEAQKGDSLHQMVERVSARLGAHNVVQLHTRADHRPEVLQKWILINNLDKFKSFISSNNIAKNSINTRPISEKTSHININNKLIDTSLAILKTQPRAASRATSQAPSQVSLQPDALYPTWLLSAPLPLAVLHGTPHYQGPLTLVAGPQRLETGWFDAPALRDYFIARSEQAGLLWVFRERLGQRQGVPEATGREISGNARSGAWYLHGRFD